MSGQTISLAPNADPLVAPKNAGTGALVSTLQVKAPVAGRPAGSGGGVLYGAGGTTTTTQFIQFHDLIAAPGAGAVPAYYLPITTAQPWSVDFGVHGRGFLNGMFIVNSTTGPTYTAGAADTEITARYL